MQYAHRNRQNIICELIDINFSKHVLNIFQHSSTIFNIRKVKI